MTQKKFKKADALLLLALFLAGLLVAGILVLTGRNGATVQVRVSGEVTASYPLDTDRTVVIEGADGGTNTLVIRDGEAFVESASCPDGLCVGMGHIKRSGQSVVCLPNEVVVEITEGETGEADAVAK